MFGGTGCNPLVDPLWADERFRGAMGNLGIRPCPLARPWPVPTQGKNGAEIQQAQTDRRRQIPNGAKFQEAPNSKRR
jgi:hypothetical protein